MVRGRVRPATREPTRQVPFSRTLAFSWYVAHVSWFPGVRKSVFLHFLVYRHGTAKNVAKSVFVHFAVLGPGTLIFSVAWPWCVAASVRQVPFSRTLAFSWHVDLVFGSAYPCAMSRSPFSSTVRNHGLCARSSDHPDAVSVSLVPISFCLHVACGTRFVVPWGHPDVLLHLPIFGTAGTKNTSSPHKHRPNTCPHSRKLSSGSRFRSFTYSLPTVHHGVQLFIRAQTLFLPTQSCCWVCLEIIILHALYNLACF